jgi:hypothetical protein
MDGNKFSQIPPIYLLMTFTNHPLKPGECLRLRVMSSKPVRVTQEDPMSTKQNTNKKPALSQACLECLAISVSIMAQPNWDMKLTIETNFPSTSQILRFNIKQITT